MKTSTRSILIADIQIGENRRSVGDIKELAKSIANVGLLHPIVVGDSYELVAGLHRLRACESLGWTRIPATVLSIERLRAELAELDENLVRQELTVLERGETLARRKGIYEALHPNTRKGVAGGQASGDVRRGARTSERISFAGEVARRTHLTPRTIQHEVQIATAIPQDVRDVIRDMPLANRKLELIQLARMPHAQQRQIVRRLGKKQQAVRVAQARLVADRLNRRPSLPEGPFDVIVLDPPWEAGNKRVAYPTMSTSDVEKLDVHGVVAEDAAVWLWVTNKTMPEGFACLAAWGLTLRTILTWIKPNPGTGQWLRSQTEHCLLATEGSPKFVLTTQTTALHAPARDHSRKPEEFYKLVESLCPGNKLDMFARESRPGWKTWGVERTKFDRKKLDRRIA